MENLIYFIIYLGILLRRYQALQYCNFTLFKQMCCIVDVVYGITPLDYIETYIKHLSAVVKQTMDIVSEEPYCLSLALEFLQHSQNVPLNLTIVNHLMELNILQATHLLIHNTSVMLTSIYNLAAFD
jgi:hypothetical protein